MSPRSHPGPQCVVIRCVWSGTYEVVFADEEPSSAVLAEMVIPWQLCLVHAQQLGTIDEESKTVLLTEDSVPHGWRLHSAPRFMNQSNEAGLEVVLYPPGYELPSHPYRK